MKDLATQAITVPRARWSGSVAMRRLMFKRINTKTQKRRSSSKKIAPSISTVITVEITNQTIACRPSTCTLPHYPLPTVAVCLIPSPLTHQLKWLATAVSDPHATYVNMTCSCKIWCDCRERGYKALPVQYMKKEQSKRQAEKEHNNAQHVGVVLIAMGLDSDVKFTCLTGSTTCMLLSGNISQVKMSSE